MYRLVLRLAAAAALLLAAPGYAGGLADAEAALVKGDPAGARALAAAVTRDDPDNSAAHLLQAQAFLALGDGIGAQAELTRARSLGIAPADTRHLMAEALFQQGQSQRALDEADPAGVSPRFAAEAARLRGRINAVQGDGAAAGAAFQLALRLAPKDARTWSDFGRFRLDDGDIAGAVEAADRAVALSPRDPAALTLKGELVRRQYGLTAAVGWFDRALAADPNDVAALLEKAATEGDLGRSRAMLATVRQALAIDGRHPMAFYLQAVLAARARNFDLARAMMRRTDKRLDDMPAAMLLMGVIEYQSGNLQQAISWLDRLVEAQPGNVKARRLLGAAQWRSGDAYGAIVTLRPLADLPQADSYTLTLIGRALEATGDRAAAATYLDRAAWPARGTGAANAPIDPVQLGLLRRKAGERPGDVAARAALVGGLLRAGLPQDALAEAQALQALDPGSPAAHVLVGDAQQALGQWREAANAYARAANMGFTEPVALRLIDAQRRAGDLAGATRTLNLFLQQNPQNVAAQLIAADLQMAAARWKEAATLLEGLRHRLGDRDAALLNNLAWAQYRAGRPAEGIAAAERAYRLSPANPAIADTYGWLLTVTKANPRRGLALLEQARAQAPRTPGVQWHLAQAYAAAGRAGAAREAADAALALPGFAEPAKARALLATL